MARSRAGRAWLATMLVMVELALPTVLSAQSAHRATWINVWFNSNQTYVPQPDGKAKHGIQCDWEVALQKYGLQLPAGLTIRNNMAVDWVGGDNFGNAWAMIALIQRANVDTLIPDFTNGFSNANSKFPVEILHSMVATHFSTMHIAYAVSAGGFASAKAYLESPSADTRNYLYRQGRPVVVVYATAADYDVVKAANPGYFVILANGESTQRNKGGWHTEPFSGFTDVSDDVFFVAPSLDWQAGTSSTYWRVSTPWLAAGLLALAAMPAPPAFMVVVGSFDDASERNMWMPAITSGADDEAFRVRSLDGAKDKGRPSLESDWTVLYDMVAAYFARGQPPPGHLQRLRFAGSLSLYISPPPPFNQHVGSATSAFARTSHPLYPSHQLLFPLPPPGSLLSQFRFLSRDDQVVTAVLTPRHFMDCHQCNRSVCVAPLSDRVLPPDLPIVAYNASTPLSDCNVLGEGVAFLTSSAAGQVVSVAKTYSTQDLVYLYPAHGVGPDTIVHALSAGRLYRASEDFSRVEAVLPEAATNSSRHLWTVTPARAAQPLSLSILSPQGQRLVWAVDSSPSTCPGMPLDCLHDIILAPG